MTLCDAWQREASGTLDQLVDRPHLCVEVTKVTNAALVSMLAGGGGGAGGGGSSAGGGGGA